MALVRCDFFAESLGVGSSMTVVLPQPSADGSGPAATDASGPPVLYLLHGLGDDDTAWLRHTSIERYAAPLGIAVVMPALARSFATDEANGNRYWTFLSDELPDLVARFFRVSGRREDTYVAGLSMGGYAALRWALSRPDRFAAAASLSGGLDVATLYDAPDWRPDLVRLIWGDRSPRGTAGDLQQLLAEVRSAPNGPPALYVGCGTGDERVTHTEWFAALAQDAGVPLTVDLVPGDHDWAYWDRSIRDVLRWLPLHRAGVG